MVGGVEDGEGATTDGDADAVGVTEGVGVGVAVDVSDGIGVVGVGVGVPEWLGRCCPPAPATGDGVAASRQMGTGGQFPSVGGIDATGTNMLLQRQRASPAAE
jgi:hypothetical protein